MDFPSKLNDRLSERKVAGAMRVLSFQEGVDFSSNDYLGFAKCLNIKQKMASQAMLPTVNLGATGSRLISGNSKLCEEVEVMLADFHQAEAGLIFNSGYDANLGFFSCIPQRGDTILYDYLAHASIRDGIRLSHAKSHAFAHNDLADLRQKLTRAEGAIYVVVESIYSMDGDEAPLIDLVDLCTEFGAYLIVDEAHSTGLYGEHGRGLVSQLKLCDKVFARLHTFGKAIGCHGAIWLGSYQLRNYLINFCRAFIYTTALPEHSLHNIKFAYQQLFLADQDRNLLQENIVLFKSQVKSKQLLPSNSPIQGFVVPGNEAVVNAARHLQAHGLLLKPIRYPTVPLGSERLRIIIHSYNTKEEINYLASALNELSA